MPKPMFVVTADVHLHPHKTGNTYDENGRSSRVDLTIQALRRVFTFAREAEIPVFILGDLLHDKYQIPVEVLDPLLELQREFTPQETIALVGNHERPDRFTTVHTLEFLRSGGWYIKEEVEKVEGETYDVYFLPWFSDFTKPCEKLRELVAASDPAKPRILFGHGCVDGTLSDNGFTLSNPGLTPEMLWLPSFNLALFGDIHKRQIIADNAQYVGALTPQNFGERHNPAGFAVVYDDFTVRHVEISEGPRFEYTDEAEGSQPSKMTPYMVNLDEDGNTSMADLGTQCFLKPNPEVVAEAARLRHAGMQVDMDTTDLESMVRAYFHSRPPENESTTVEDVINILKGYLGAAECV